MKVWIYKGDILPYQLTNDEKIVREAAMAAGDAVPVAAARPPRPRASSRAGGGRRRVEAEAVVETEASTDAARSTSTPPTCWRATDPRSSAAERRRRDRAPHGARAHRHPALPKGR